MAAPNLTSKLVASGGHLDLQGLPIYTLAHFPAAIVLGACLQVTGTPKTVGDVYRSLGR